MIADDLFAGAGGWDLAAANLGIHARGVENMKEARATRDAAGLSTIHDDVWTFQPDGNATGLIASPPCQTFSQAGKGTGRKALDDVLTAIRHRDWRSTKLLKAVGEKAGDDRTALVLTPLHFAMTNPAYRWLAWEQVPTVLPVWEACADTLRAYGWSVWTGLLQAEMYGVPQTRKRAFLMASRTREVGRPTPTHSRYYPRNPTKLDDGVEKWVSMADALTWDARPSFIRMTKMPNSAQRNIDHPAPTIAFGHDAASCRWFYDDPTAGLPDWTRNRPSTTIVGSFKPEIVAAPGYRTTVSRQNAPDSVRISIAEAGILQSFPADFPWSGPKGKQFLQAGNAVPPGLAAHAIAAAAGVEREEVAA